MNNLGNKQIMATNIKRNMMAKGVTATDICSTLDIPMATFSDWTHAKTYPRIDKIEMLANYFGISKADLVEEHSDRNPIPPGCIPFPQVETVPIVGSIACGTPITAEENIEGRTGVLAQWHADFALICKGHSMEPKINDGDIVAIRIQPTVENGQIAAVRIENEATLKKVYLYSDRLELRPINSDFESMILYGDEMNAVAIEGLAVGLCRGI